MYSYFQKAVKTPLVIGEASAMSDHQKFSILIRRMSNVSDKIRQEESVKLVDEFKRELKNSGYTRVLIMH